MPAYASHYVGVGGLVFDSTQTKMLAIQERFYLAPDTWKLPGGRVDTGEEIGKAAEREVWEETGVLTDHQGILSFRELTNYQFGQQDMYFVCL